MNNHTCDTIVVSCIDFRFQKYIRGWLDKNLAHKTFDYVGFAGSTKDLDAVLKQVDIAVRLHSVKEVVLMHHEDCGAYGNESTFERHQQDLLKAKKEILAKHNNLQISLYYIRLDGTFEQIQ